MLVNQRKHRSSLSPTSLSFPERGTTQPQLVYGINLFNKKFGRFLAKCWGGGHFDHHPEMNERVAWDPILLTIATLLHPSTKPIPCHPTYSLPSHLHPATPPTFSGLHENIHNIYFNYYHPPTPFHPTYTLPPHLHPATPPTFSGLHKNIHNNDFNFCHPSSAFHPTYTLPPHLHFQGSLEISVIMI